MSVPAALQVGAQHLVIDVGAAVAQNLVEGVPIPFAPSLAEIDLREQDLFGVTTGRSGNGPSGVTDDQALPLEELAALGADTVGTRNEDRIAVLGGHR